MIPIAYLSPEIAADEGSMDPDPNPLHPNIAGIIAALTPGVPRETFRAQVGRRPTFLSASDADAYARGYLNGRSETIGTPEWQGMLDRLDAGDSRDDSDRYGGALFEVDA